MSRIDQLSKELNKVTQNFTGEIVRPVIFDNLEQFEGLQRDQFLNAEDSEGNALPVYRNPAYVRSKRPPQSGPGFRWNLRLTTAYYRGIQAEAGNQALIIRNTDSKAEELQEKYEARGGAANLLGLTQKSRLIAKEEFLLQDIQNEIRFRLL